MHVPLRHKHILLPYYGGNGQGLRILVDPSTSRTSRTLHVPWLADEVFLALHGYTHHPIIQLSGQFYGVGHRHRSLLSCWCCCCISALHPVVHPALVRAVVLRSTTHSVKSLPSTWQQKQIGGAWWYFWHLGRLWSKLEDERVFPTQKKRLLFFHQRKWYPLTIGDLYWWKDHNKHKHSVVMLHKQFPKVSCA